MKVGDLVIFKADGDIGIIISIRSNGDCRVQFPFGVMLAAGSGLEVI